MITGGQYQSVSVAQIELDRSNPRIRKFLEMYSDELTPERIYLALGAGGDDDGGATSTTFEKLKNSILTNGGVIQPVVLNRKQDGTIVCIEGNTRVAIYKSFLNDGVKWSWDKIPAIVHDNLGDAEIDAIRLQVHLVGPRPWDPYSKAKYLHYLRTQKHLPFNTIVDFCGGRQRDVEESINAYSDMEAYYRPIVPDDGSFDTTRFSGFVELQKPGIKDAIVKSGHDLKDFAQWIYEEKIYPLNKVRILPRILRHPKAKDVFLKHGARKAEEVLDRPDLNKALKDADLGHLARALIEAIAALPWSESQRLRAEPTGETAQYIVEAHQALSEMVTSLGLNG